MLLAYLATGEELFKLIGLDSLEFLLEQTYVDGRFDFIGNQGWHRRGERRAIFIQQPIDAAYTADTCMVAYEATKDQRYIDLAIASAEWLLGRNRLGARLYDSATGACADGLDPQGPSLNQGAESAICGLLSLMVVCEPRVKVLDASATGVTSAVSAVSRFEVASAAK
jgi:uncharacterized protein YyaL (SSP411 family)